MGALKNCLKINSIISFLITWQNRKLKSTIFDYLVYKINHCVVVVFTFNWKKLYWNTECKNLSSIFIWWFFLTFQIIVNIFTKKFHTEKVLVRLSHNFLLPCIAVDEKFINITAFIFNFYFLCFIVQQNTFFSIYCLQFLA